jgi:hypothetical protein
VSYDFSFDSQCKGACFLKSTLLPNTSVQCSTCTLAYWFTAAPALGWPRNPLPSGYYIYVPRYINASVQYNQACNYSWEGKPCVQNGNTADWGSFPAEQQAYNRPTCVYGCQGVNGVPIASGSADYQIW